MSAHDEDAAGFRFGDESPSGEMPSPWHKPAEKMPTEQDVDEHGFIAAWQPGAGFALIEPKYLSGEWLDPDSLQAIGILWARIEDVVTLPKEATH